MTAFTYYIVRHKETGVILPEKTLSSQFEFKHQPANLTPRLFRNERAANCCINAWGAGVWGREISTESEGWEHPSYQVISEPLPMSKTRRDKRVLEAVPATLAY